MEKYEVITECGYVIRKRWLDTYGFVKTRSRCHPRSDYSFDLKTAKRLARLFGGKVVKVKEDEK